MRATGVDARCTLAQCRPTFKNNFLRRGDYVHIADNRLWIICLKPACLKNEIVRQTLTLSRIS
jgi:hypothetical protein